MCGSRISLLLFAVFLNSQYVSAQINLTEYYRMPPLYELDDYDRCMMGQAHPEKEGIYCYTKALIQPNSSVEIWNIINKYASDTKHFYRHDRLNRGICMDRCMAQMLHYDYDTRMKYYLPKFTNDSAVAVDPDIFRNSLHDHEKYNKFATMCVNYELQKKYGLMAQTDIIYCIKSFDKSFTEYDIYDISFLVLCAVLLTIIVLSTAYDFYLKRRNLPHMCNREHYKRPVDRGLDTTLVSFSLVRNWYKLTSESGSSNSELSRDLRSINAIRCISMFGVILGHCALLLSLLPIQNPEYLERRYFSVFSMIIINGVNILQSYFAITGYLITVQFMDLREKNKFNTAYFWKAIVYRYLRFTPVYVFMIFLHATLLFHMQSGPMWPHMADSERSVCRSHFWTNLLYINNFVESHEPCMQHAWYLAADFQLVIVGTFIQMILWRFPKYTKTVLGTCLVISFIIPSAVTYVNSFEGIFMATLENQRHAHWFDVMYHTIYIPSYTNFGSFLFGMIGGYLYCLHKQGHIDMKRSKILAILWWCMIPIAIGALLSGYPFYENDFEKPSLWIAIYSAFGKNVWGFFGATVVTGIALNHGWVIKEFFRLPIFRTMGRLTFGAYLIHPAVMRVSGGSMRQPIYGNDAKGIEALVSTYFISYLFAMIMCICVELPFSTLQRQLFNKDKAPTESTQTVYESSEPESGKLSKNLSDNLELKNNNNHLGN